jgi:hypothetical protein
MGTASDGFEPRGRHDYGKSGLASRSMVRGGVLTSSAPATTAITAVTRGRRCFRCPRSEALSRWRRGSITRFRPASWGRDAAARAPEWSKTQGFGRARCGESRGVWPRSLRGVEGAAWIASDDPHPFVSLCAGLIPRGAQADAFGPTGFGWSTRPNCSSDGRPACRAGLSR